MTVQELIEKLKTVDQNSKVISFNSMEELIEVHRVTELYGYDMGSGDYHTEYILTNVPKDRVHLYEKLVLI